MTRVTEKQFMRQVIQLAHLLGWSAYHTFDSRRSSPGFPDCVFAKPGRAVVFAELKSDTGITSSDQDEWLSVLRRAGARVYVWRPADWTEIERVLGE